jgi:hypothetical protein
LLFEAYRRLYPTIRDNSMTISNAKVSAVSTTTYDLIQLPYMVWNPIPALGNWTYGGFNVNATTTSGFYANCMLPPNYKSQTPLTLYVNFQLSDISTASGQTVYWDMTYGVTGAGLGMATGSFTAVQSTTFSTNLSMCTVTFSPLVMTNYSAGSVVSFFINRPSGASGYTSAQYGFIGGGLRFQTAYLA